MAKIAVHQLHLSHPIHSIVEGIKAIKMFNTCNSISSYLFPILSFLLLHNPLIILPAISFILISLCGLILILIYLLSLLFF